MTKRLANLVRACLTLLVWLSGSAGAAAATAEIRAGLEQNPPLSFIDEQGKPSGILVDVLDRVAAREGWRLVYVPDTFDRCLEKLAAGDLDLMVTIAYSPERAERFDFNRVNVVANWGVLYTGPDVPVETYFDLAGKKVAVMRKDIHHQAFRTLLQKFGIQVEFLPLDNFDQVFAAVQSGEAEAGVVGRFYALRKEEAYRVRATPIIFNPIEVHYAVRKGSNGQILAALDRDLEEFKADRGSVYYQSLERWLGVLSKRGVPAWVKLAAPAGGALLALLFGFNQVLRRQVRARTAHLEREITERTRAQQALAASENQYRELVESVNAIILRLDTEGRIVFMNDFGERFFGFGKEEIAGRSAVGTIVPELDMEGRDLAVMIRELCVHPETFSINENENVKKNGERVWISWRNRPVCDAQGALLGLLCVGQDITERKKAEVALRAIDRAKDSFISTAAHELRTPLTSIIGYAELLLDCRGHGGFAPEQVDEFCREIQVKGEKLSRIVDDLLDITRIQHGVELPLNRTSGSLPALVREVVRQFTFLHRHHRFAVDIGADVPPELLFDADRIGQVLENLLSNAVKYSVAGSEIVIAATAAEAEVTVSVSDHGIGMTPDQSERAFDKFYRADTSDTAVGGLGLGLNIARELVESHGGRILIESRPGDGTTVTFTLPC